ncbi:MAG: TRAP transporter large permease subunit [Gammaproteobacteria bacterium]|nr:TRAP transporter large permease subunit [Gammaproteobacteria bacterium]
MDQGLMMILLTVLMFGILSLGVWVGAALFIVGFAALMLNESSNLGMIMSTTTWGSTSTWTLTALPLFVWMGEILFRTRLSKDLFSGLSPWLNHVPGRLLHVNILGCGIFAAVSGSSAATVATIGKMTAPELEKRGYPESMVLGTLAGSGTLGLLIPPSIILIVYGVSAEISISRLFIAGALPGLMLVALFMGYTMIWSSLNKDKLPAADAHIPLVEKFRASWKLIPVVSLILFVLGSIYAGFATATEAAVIGVAGSLVLSWLGKDMNWLTFRESLMGATKTSCMIMFILAGAAFLTIAMGFTGIPRVLAENISSMNLSPGWLLFALTIFFIVMGCFLDGISVVVLTTSVVLPMVEQAGIDLLWFGIFLVMVVEMAQVTPPVGFNLFVLQGLTGKNIILIAKYAVPFFLLLMLAALLISIFPEIATWLPQKMTER